VAGRLVAVRDRLARAEEHHETVKRLVREYYESDRCRYAGTYDPQVDHVPIRQSIVFPDIRLSTLVGEMLHDLRSALDHLAWQLVLENGGAPDERTCFPILRAGPTPKRGQPPAPPSVSGGVSVAASALIERHQPYRFGWLDPSDPPWLLQRLNIIDKHRQMAIWGVALVNMSIGGGAPMLPFHWHSEFVEADAFGAELRLVPDTPGLGVQGTATVALMVREEPHPEIALMSTLLAVGQEVRQIVEEAAVSCFLT
jgi:hypothetical protein